MIILPRRRDLLAGVDTPNISWATWDQVTESGWGDPDIFIVLAEAPNLWDNEVGQKSGLGLADRTLTNNGDIAGAVGSGTGKYREFSAVASYFSVTATLTDLIKSQTKWMMVHKFSHIANNAGDHFFQLEAAVAGNAQIILRIKANQCLEMIYNEDGGVQEILATADTLDMASPTPTWIGIHADGANNVRFWFHTSANLPLSWDDINANTKATLATAGFDGTLNFSFTTLNFVSGANNLGARWYYSLISSGKTLWE